MAKATARPKSNNHNPAVRVSRPALSKLYGIPKHNKGLLDWAHVQERMTNAKVYWICTASPDGKPHATPVDGVWLNDKLYFGGDPSTRRNRHLDANPAVSIHLESGHEVVILEGDARPLDKSTPEFALRLANASNDKYGYGVNPEQYRKKGSYVFSPRVVFAWKQFPIDVTRWEFDE